MKKKCRVKALLASAFLACLAASGLLAPEADAKAMERNVPGLDKTMPAEIQENKITDLSEVYEVILEGAAKEWIAGYVVDESFLMWLNAQYGDEALIDLACLVMDGEMTADSWYEITGRSLHVLWLMFCRDTEFQSYQLENVHWIECAGPEETVISFTGDFNLAEGWCTTEYMKKQPNGIYDCFSEDLLKEMQESDLMVMNNEFTYTDSSQALEGKEYVFRARPEMAELLSAFGADAVTLANNHVFDYGQQGLFDTLQTLRQNGVLSFGAGNNIQEASRILYFVANGRKIALVAATEIERTKQYTKEADDNSGGVLKSRHPEKFLSVIREAEKHSDYVLAVIHWGTEGMLYPDNSQRDMAERFVDAGADAVIGDHPHRLQGIEYVEGAPIIYSLGNFWFSDATLYTTVAQVIIAGDGSLGLKCLPCLQKGLTTRLLTGEKEKEEFYRYLAALSSDVWMDREGNVYDKCARTDSIIEPWFDSDTAAVGMTGLADIEGNAIDIVGSYKK